MAEMNSDFSFRRSACSWAMIVVTLIGLASFNQLQTVFGQSVDVRAMSDKADTPIGSGLGGAQSRQLFGQKHLSSHRMMHFGKRPMVLPPPSLIIESSQDQMGLPLVDLPTYNTENDLPIRQSPPLISYFDNLPLSSTGSADLKSLKPRKQLMDFVDNLLEASMMLQAKECAEQEREQQLQQQLIHRQVPATIRHMKLMRAEAGDQEAKFGEAAPDEQRNVSSEQAQQEPSESDSFRQDQPKSVVNRSFPPISRDQLPPFNRIQLSSLLLGRSHQSESPATMFGLGSYIKKADPAPKMTYMHFG